MMESCTYSLPRSHNGDIVCVCFNSTGDYLATCALDGTTTIYGVLTRQLTHFLEFNETPSCLTWIESQHGLPGSLGVVVGFATGSLRLASFWHGNVSLILLIMHQLVIRTVHNFVRMLGRLK
jgi:WD40 repeat protein